MRPRDGDMSDGSIDLEKVHTESSELLATIGSDLQREAFGVNRAKLVLVIVIIGRSKNHAAESTLGDEGVFAFGRLRLGAIGLVKSAEMDLEHVRHRFVFGEPKGIVERAKKQRLDGAAFRIFPDSEDDCMALGLLENHLRDAEQRI